MRLSGRRALKFWTVGAVGAVIQSVAFYFMTRTFGVPDFVALGGVEVPWALGWAIVLAAVSNYVLNEYFTWGPDMKPSEGGAPLDSA